MKDKDGMATVYDGETPVEIYEAMMADRYAPQVYDKLKEARVAVAGLGGLGSHIAVGLARVGVGHMLLVDFDRVDISNLGRQCYFMEHIGQFKTVALGEQVKRINPFMEVEMCLLRVEDYHVAGLFAGYDVLCEAFDRQEAKAMLVSAALSELPDLKVVAASGMAGYGSANDIRTERKMTNLYMCGDGVTGIDTGEDMKSDGDASAGLMAPRVQICAAHQTNMVLRLLLGMEEA